MSIIAVSKRRRVQRLLMATPIILLVVVALAGQTSISGYRIETAILSIGVTGILLLFFLTAYFRQSYESEPAYKYYIPEPAIEEKLRNMEDTLELVRGTLGLTEVFPLLGKWLEEVIPIASASLFLLDKNRERLELSQQTGSPKQNSEQLAETCFGARSIVFDLVHDGGGHLDCASIPLCHGFEIFGVMQVIFISSEPRASADLLQAIGNRVAPIVLNSISFDRSQQYALTDPTTELPNQRAFYLILENQIAETHRRRERPLSVITIDIKNFAAVNERFGHRTGDQVLNHAAFLIKKTLRQMDFFARSVADEFLVTLPTADGVITQEIIERIKSEFIVNSLQIPELEQMIIELNFGWATFGPDGETSDQLLTAARIRKSQGKTGSGQNVLWFSPSL